MSILSNHLKEVITKYVDEGIIDQSDVFKIWKAQNEKQIIKILIKILEIDDVKKTIIWEYIINELWKTTDDIFCKNEILLMKVIINNNGIISREKILKEIKTFKNNYSLNNAVDELIDMNLVVKVSLSNSKILYILSIELFNITKK